MDISIIFLGDVMPGRFIDRSNYVNQDVLHYLKSATLRICNFEGVVSSSCPALYAVKAKPIDYICKHGVSKDQAKVLVDLDIDCCNLANNHILDYGMEGVKDTIRFLNDNNIKWFGFGKNYEVAWKPRIYKLNLNQYKIDQTHGECFKEKLNISFFGVSDHFIEWKADHGAGINYFDIKHFTTEEGNPNRTMWTNINHIYKQIEKARRKSDLIVFSIHWGDNFQQNICETFRDFAHLLVDHGVHVIHGHSTHHTQSVEVYQSGVILYGCGEFINDYDLMEVALSAKGETLGPQYSKYNSHLSFMYKFNMRYRHKLELQELEMFPIQIKKGFVSRCITDENKKILFTKMIADCNALGTDVIEKDSLLYVKFA